MDHQLRPVGQAVKTSPFHGEIRGSIPLRVTKLRPRGVAVNMPPCHGGERGFESHRGRHLFKSGLACFFYLYPLSASVAQSVEQRTENPRVGGSIPP